MTVVITDNRFGDIDIERSVLEPAGIEVSSADCSNSSEVVAACRDADGILVNLAPLDAAAFDSLPRCKVVSRYGVGLDNIDLEAARRAGVTVRNVTGYCDGEVAEHALGLVLSVARKIVARDASIRAGEWNAVRPGRRVAGTVLGILGFGGTARALARAALGLGFAKILVWSPHIDAERIGAALGPLAGAADIPVLPSGLEGLLAESDWVSVNLPLRPGTRGLIDAKAIASMKRGAALVNVSRGPIVDEDALIEALAEGRLGGAGLDVFAVEPLPPGSKLRSAPNLVLTDHAAYASVESLRDLRIRCARNALEVLAGDGRKLQPPAERE